MGLNIAITPEELRALLETGFLLRERGEVDKARDVFEGVVALRPDVEVAHVGLANVYEILGRDAEAERVLKDLVARSPSSPVAHLQMGEFHHTHGRKEAARASLNRAVELDPHGNTGEGARAILKLVENDVGYTYGLNT